MPRPAPRKLTLADLMLLIAATGLGMGCFIFIDDHLYAGERYVFGIFRPVTAWTAELFLNRAEGVVAMTVTAFGGWSLVLPAMAWRRPRPLRRRLLRGAGLTACFAALFGMAALVGTTALSFLPRWLDGRMTLPANFWYAVPVIDCLFIFPGVAVASGWASQFVTGRWRPVPDVVDRLGRFVGVLWVSAGLVFAVRLFLG